PPIDPFFSFSFYFLFPLLLCSRLAVYSPAISMFYVTNYADSWECLVRLATETWHTQYCLVMLRHRDRPYGAGTIRRKWHR
ncbi:hypothetical protein BDV29DRAFT_186373, partial [Aspergillus leporis]